LYRGNQKARAVGIFGIVYVEALRPKGALYLRLTLGNLFKGASILVRTGQLVRSGPGWEEKKLQKLTVDSGIYAKKEKHVEGG